MTRFLSDASAWISIAGYLDGDGDGVGAGEAVSHCTSGGQPSGWAATGGDCAPADGAAYVLHWYTYRDADGDSATVYANDPVCAGTSPPSGYSNTAGWRGSDCDDTRSDRYQWLRGYEDADGDGVGGGTERSVCSGYSLPAGWLRSGGDCAPEDPARWEPFAYSYRDADGDGHARYSSGTLCLGDDDPPAEYSSYPTAIRDCDDGDPSVFQSFVGYLDEDGDGVGAGAGITSCTAGELPAGQRITGTDCAPADASSWQSLSYAGIDADQDGFTVPATGTVCSGAVLPAPYVSAASGNDCDDADESLWRWVVLYPDHDGDGIGAPPREIPCIGAELPPGLVPWGWDPDDGDPLVRVDAEDELLDLFGW